MRTITDRIPTAGEASGAKSSDSSRRIVGLRIRGFRSLLDISLTPGRLCALIGEAQAGKSNVLAALDALLDETRSLRRTDVTTLADTPILVEATLDGGDRLSLERSDGETTRSGDPPPVLFLPASERATGLVLAEPRSRVAARALQLVRDALEEQIGGRTLRSDALPAASLVDGLEACCLVGVRGLALLVEEPELYLGPQGQRYLYHLLRTFAQTGNQVFYTTHSANLVNVARLDELAIVRRSEHGSEVLQPVAVTPDADFRVLTEFDAQRSELLLARAALLVEGQTEKMALPFVFGALGYDADREGVSIVESGGKANIVLFARVCRAAGVPFVALHDLDRDDAVLNGEIRALAGADRTIVLDPDFERATGLRGRSHKPERAWRRFVAIERDEVPEQLERAVNRVVELARAGRHR